jgi:hypothetical protein
MDVIRKLIDEQNKDLLNIIAEDFFPDMKKEQEEFIYNYHKKNFTYMKKVIKDIKPMNEKRLKKILK